LRINRSVIYLKPVIARIELHDASKRGDITASGVVWRYGDIKRSISSVAISNGLLFTGDLRGPRARIRGYG
jgi:hypothetical protein